MFFVVFVDARYCLRLPCCLSVIWNVILTFRLQRRRTGKRSCPFEVTKHQGCGRQLRVWQTERRTERSICSARPPRSLWCVASSSIKARGECQERCDRVTSSVGQWRQCYVTPSRATAATGHSSCSVCPTVICNVDSISILDKVGNNSKYITTTTTYSTSSSSTVKNTNFNENIVSTATATNVQSASKKLWSAITYNITETWSK